MKDIYNKKSHRYTAHDKKLLDKLFRAGSSDADIANVLGRTEKAIKCQRTIMGLKRRKRKGPKLEPKGGARYTRYMKPKTELSLLWGLIKYTKA